MNLKSTPLSEVCLDHCHVTGNVREALCRNCNGIEGKIFNLARRAKRDRTPLEFLMSLVEYWDKHLNNPSALLHPTHKTADEKRIARNAKARKARAAKKKK